MKKAVITGAIGAVLVAAGCASEQGASMKSVGVAEAPQVEVKDNKRHEVVVGSRIARETRESAESVKTLSRRAWQERKTDMQGSPLDGGS
jgi:hypothetical protein